TMNIIWKKKYIHVLCRRCLSSANLYDKLGVSPAATQAEIKKAYIELSKLYHPDAKTAQSSSEKFAEINAAYETLGRADRRRLYDSERLWRSAAAASSAASSASPPPPGGGRRSAGPSDFEQRMRHEMEWMYRASRQQQGGPESASWDDEVNSSFKVKIVVALAAVIVIGVGVRLFVMSIIQASQHRRDETEYQLAMSLLKQSEDTKGERMAAMGPQWRRAGQQRSAKQQRASPSKPDPGDIDPDYLAQLGGGFRGARTVAPSHARSMQSRRLANFRRSATAWSAETRAALRPRLSAELVEELDKLEAEERTAAASTG
ncbi:hypothetical protein BOX15_Mlig024607g1, partial [Macrostomum lignano]